MAKYEFEFGQGEVRQMDIGQMWVRIEDREIITQVMFNDEGIEPLLGAMALEGTFLGVDLVRQEPRSHSRQVIGRSLGALRL